MDAAAQQGACEPLKEQRDVQERGAGETGTWLQHVLNIDKHPL